jgi:hypothetical protein
MDVITIGFISIVVIYMIGKFFFNLRMYRNSIYEVLYSGFTEYRMRMKSVEEMSESCVLTEKCGPNRIIYYVIEKEHSVPTAFVTIFLTSGCYILALKKKNENTDSFFEAKEFEKQNIASKLEDTVYKALEFPTTIITVLPDDSKAGNTEVGKKNKQIVRRKVLIDTIKALHDKAEKVLTANDVNGMFMTLAHDTIENEKISMT